MPKHPVYAWNINASLNERKERQKKLKSENYHTSTIYSGFNKPGISRSQSNDFEISDFNQTKITNQNRAHR